MEFLIVLAVLVIVVLVLAGPLRGQRIHSVGEGSGRRSVELDVEGGNGSGPEVAELEAEREAKYREIRDAELDHRTGKLSDADFEAVDGALRAEALQILRALDRAKEESQRRVIAVGPGHRYHRRR